MWRFPEWPWRASSERHQIDVLVALIRQGIDPLTRWSFVWEDPEPLLATARDIVAGD